MLIGQTIMVNGTAITTVFSPWFLRQGNAATFGIEILAASNGKVTVTVQTKNSEDPDPGSPATGGTFLQSGVGRNTGRNHDLDELVRYKLEVQGLASGDGFAHFRMLEPIWEHN